MRELTRQRCARNAPLQIVAHPLGLICVAHDQIVAVHVFRRLGGSRASFLVVILAMDDRGEPVPRITLHALPDVEYRAACSVDDDTSDLPERLEVVDCHSERWKDDHIFRAEHAEIEPCHAREEELDPHVAQLGIDVRIMDDLTGQNDSPVWKLSPRLVGVLDRPLDSIAKAELSGQPKREVTGLEGILTAPEPIHEIAVVVGRQLRLDFSLETEALSKVGLVSGRSGDPFPARCRGSRRPAGIPQRVHKIKSSDEHPKPPVSATGEYISGVQDPSLIELVAGPPGLIRPPAISKGDAIGVVAPSYAPRAGWLQRGVKALNHAGYEVILDSEILQARRFQRREDERRAENFMAMWIDPRVKAVIGGTGGYGAIRMLPYLEPELFRQNPKPFVGYSDITALHLWLMRRSGLRVFHGPTVDDLVPSTRDPTMASLLAALTIPLPNTRLGRDVARTVRGGRASGRLTGGNLSLVQQTIGTPYEIDTRDAILFLEEANDPMSVADERLVHLRAAGLLRHVRGVVFGQLSLDRSEEDEFEDFLLDLVDDLGIPIIMDFPAGHEVPNLTLPLGTEVEMVAEEGTGWLVYKEDALVGRDLEKRAESVVGG
jgi:muramoyltetrapeptide carboxypeptidase